MSLATFGVGKQGVSAYKEKLELREPGNRLRRIGPPRYFVKRAYYVIGP